MKLLITAFQPFDNRETNVSKEVVDKLDTSNMPFIIIKQTLPVSLVSSFLAIKKTIEEEKPDVILLCGEAISRRKISLELEAKNYVGRSIDPLDEIRTPNHQVIENGPSKITSIFPISYLQNLLFTNLVQSQISTDAGSYICNALYYQVMYYYPKISCLFIHFPNPTYHLSIDHMIKAIDITIQNL